MDGLIPAIVNRRSGSATEAAKAFREIGGFEVHDVEPSEVRRTALELVARRPRRMLVCGGDGTVGTVAQTVANTGIELAIAPAGTLNHLARHLGLPENVVDAAK